MLNLGFFNASGTRTHVRFQFSTHAGSGANVAPSSAIDAADIRIYKAADGAAFSATQRSSANGITVTSPFDSLTGFHDVDIDLTDDTDSGFYSAGAAYSVVLAPNDETIDSLVITGVVLAVFEIGRPQTDVRELGGSTQSATDLKDFADDGYDPSTNKITGVVLTDTVTTYTGNTPQTGDAYARIGATGSGLTTLALQSSVDDLPTNAELNTALGTADDAVLAAIAALNNLSAAQVNAEVDTALSDYDGPTNAELATALGTADDAILAAIAALNNLSSAQAQTAVTSALTAALTEGYRGTGATGSVRDLLYEIIAHMGESSISSVTKTIKKLDGSTTAKTYTLDSSSAPTSITETT
jgi:hypothetical protein